MTKNEFLSQLEKLLRQREIADVDDILQEYTEHFTFKMQDGYAEEEIAAKLGDPETIALQYDRIPEPAGRNTGMKVAAGIGLGVIDLFTGCFLIVLYVFSVVLAALAVLSLTIAVSYIGGMNPYGLLPPMPYHCALLMAFTMLALTLLSVLGVYFWTALVNQMVRSYLRYRKNFMAAASGSTRLLPRPVRMQTPPKVWRTLRKLLLVSLCLFVFGFIATYAVCAITSGALEWWHVWNWFV